ncbi:MAG: SMEK domain-containing protein [Methylococcales bacterium]|nr:SMEK domain-containing protein [Methylococcales bacterium]
MENINTISPNAEAIDLGDLKNKTAIQVTSTSAIAKTRKTYKVVSLICGHIWTPHLLQAKFFIIFDLTGIKIAAIYSVSNRGVSSSGRLMSYSRAL